MAQQKRTRRASMRTQIPSLASLSGLRIWRCRELRSRSQMRLRFCIVVAVVLWLAWEFSYATGTALQTNKQTQTKKRTN